MLDPKEKCGVFLDIDNTLTTERFYIPEENRRAISRARERGHMVFINTGRSWGNIPESLLKQAEFDGIVAGSGAYVSIGGEVIFSASIPKKTVLKAAEYIFAHRDYWIVMEGLKKCYAISNEKRKINDLQTPVESTAELEAYLENDEIQVIAVAGDVSEEFKELFADELTLFPMGYYYDCVVKGLNKGTGIRVVEEAAGIKRENTIAIGDGGNDIDMIRYAGIGVAMKNAQPHILMEADFVTESNTDFGVAAAIEKFLLK